MTIEDFRQSCFFYSGEKVLVGASCDISFVIQKLDQQKMAVLFFDGNDYKTRERVGLKLRDSLAKADYIHFNYLIKDTESTDPFTGITADSKTVVVENFYSADQEHLNEALAKTRTMPEKRWLFLVPRWSSVRPLESLQDLIASQNPLVLEISS